MKTALIALTTLATAISWAQQGPSVSASAPATAHAGKAVTLTVSVSVPDGYHIYGPKDKTGIATSVEFSGPKTYRATVEWPKTSTFKGIGDVSQVYYGKVHIPVVVSVPKSAHGKVSMKLAVTTQACNDRTCLPPHTDSFNLSTTVK